MKKVVPNFSMLPLRLIVIGIFGYMLQWPIQKLQTPQYSNNPIAFWLGLVVVYMLPIYFMCTLLGILWVKISDDNRIIKFHHIYKTVVCSSLDIDSYSKVTESSNLRRYKGLKIKLKTGKVIKVTEYNLKSVNEIGYFLRINRIPLS